MEGYRHSSFCCASLIALWRYYIFYKLKVCGNPASSKSICTICPTTLFTACLSITFWLPSFVQPLSRVWLYVTPWTAAHQASLSFTISQSLLNFMSIVSMMPSNHLILCHPLSSCLQSFPASGSFPMSQLSASSGQSVKASASASVLPMNIQCWFPLGLTILISLLSKRLSRVFSNTTAQKHQFFIVQPSLWSNSHIHTWLLEKP